MAGKDFYSAEYFGSIIAFVLPGFLGLWVIAQFDQDSPAAIWLATAGEKETTVGAFLFVGLASLGIGIVLSGFRWVLFEMFGLLKLLGVPARATVDHRERRENEGAYREITENHYKFYLFYANTATAALMVFPAIWDKLTRESVLMLVLLEVVLTACARDAIIRYREKEKILLGLYEPPEKRTVPQEKKRA